MRTIKILLFAFASVSASATLAQLESGEDVLISKKVRHDLYVAGGTVSVNAAIEGDLTVAGGTITVTDTIAQDFLGAGSNVVLNGYVGDDVRCAGGTIRLSNIVAGDVIITGGTITIDERAIINGDLLVSGGRVTVDGEVKGSIKSASGELTLNGKVQREIDCRGGKVVIDGTVVGNSILAANTIEIGSQAHFSRDVTYWNNEGSLAFGNSLDGGQATFDSSLEPDSGKWHFLGFASLLILLWYLGTALIMIILIHYFFGGTFKKAADSVKNSSLKSLGLGFLFVVGIPIAIVVTVMTVVGIPIGVLGLIAYVTILLLGTVIVALLAAHWINNTYYHSAWKTGRVVLVAFSIFIFLKLFSLTPFVGPLIMALLACMAFGGILLNVKWKRNKELTITEDTYV
jgi:cytoskeletal protein CcmA (bactofilin family)